jgi:hypothetical protein
MKALRETAKVSTSEQNLENASEEVPAPQPTAGVARSGK